ncbi:MAG: DUF4446 family protein [Candidatus Moranbacteria bacterium]|nr:DUF4446 family protein [Candidatus Moranbacteria bacterium]NTW45941.1 DUF4446 family protein [Candidatus Moranbacteria bacterium]
MEGLFSASVIVPLTLASIGIGSLGLLVSVLLFFRVRKLRKDLTALFSGKTGVDLEEIILKQKEGLDAADEEIRKLYGIAEQLYRLGQESIHKTGLLRFNPFKEVGGNQSFAVALLDGKNTGFVISSIHTREGTRVYAKPVEKGSETKEYPLSDEERHVVGAAAGKRPVAFGKTRTETKG